MRRVTKTNVTLPRLQLTSYMFGSLHSHNYSGPASLTTIAIAQTALRGARPYAPLAVRKQNLESELMIKRFISELIKKTNSAKIH